MFNFSFGKLLLEGFFSFFASNGYFFQYRFDQFGKVANPAWFLLINRFLICNRFFILTQVKEKNFCLRLNSSLLLIKFSIKDKCRGAKLSLYRPQNANILD